MPLASRFTALRDWPFSALLRTLPSDTSEGSGAHEGDKSLRTFLPLAFFLYLTALLITDISVVTIPYAFSDDYPALSAALHHNLTAEVQSRVAGGRPILALLFYLTFSLVRGVSDLGIVRLSGIVMLAALACLLYWALLKAGWYPQRALPVPLIICTLPALQIYVAWAIAVFALLGMVAAGVAAILVDRAYEQLEAQPRNASLTLLVGGATLSLLFALTIDQPAAMVYWVFAAISLLVTHRSISQILKRFLVFLGVAIIGMGLEFLILKYLYGWIYGQPDTLSRTALAKPSDIPYKAVWFIAKPITDSLNFYNLSFTLDHLISNGEIAVAMGIFIICGFFLYVGGSFLNMLINGILAFCLLPLAYVPNLLVVENWPSYRTQCALGGLLTLYAAMALYGFMSKLGRTAQRVIAPTIVAVAALLGMLAAANIVTSGIAELSYVELHVAIMQLEQQKGALTTASAIYFIPNASSDSVVSVVRYDEFGTPSASKPWTPSGMTYLAMEQVDPTRADLPIIVLPANESPPPQAVVLDMRLLRDFAGQPLP